MKETVFRAVYDRAVEGLPVLGTPDDFAARLLEESGTPAHAADAATSFVTTLGAATGFVCGLPGILLVPVTLPANVLGTLALQLHLAATIAALAGRDLRDPDTRLQCIACVRERIGRPGRNDPDEELASRAGLKILERAARTTADVVTRGARWATKRVALRRLGRRIPVLGGLVGAGTDGYVTHHVGRCASARFLG